MTSDQGNGPVVPLLRGARVASGIATSDGPGCGDRRGIGETYLCWSFACPSGPAELIREIRSVRRSGARSRPTLFRARCRWVG